MHFDDYANFMILMGCSAQPEPVVPQGPYQKVFDISYHQRDARRRFHQEEVDASRADTTGLPPTPGVPTKSTFLGMAGDFDVNP